MYYTIDNFMILKFMVDMETKYNCDWVCLRKLQMQLLAVLTK